METLLQVVFILLGVGLLWFGANWLVSSSSDLARRFRLSEAVIGGTVVALGTSMPELIATGMAAYKGNAGIAYGNIVGSNICNIMLILGLAAFSRKWREPMRPSSGILNHDGTWMILSVCVLGVFLGLKLGVDGDSASSAGHSHILTWAEGWILLGLYGLFLLTTVIRAVRGRVPEESDDNAVSAADQFSGKLTPEQEQRSVLEAGHVQAAAARQGEIPAGDVRKPARAWWMDVTILVVSLVVLAVGADLLVRGASGIAIGLGIPELVVGLTVVAVGTSMPELATSLIAGKRDKDDIAVANVTGSNIQNILLCLGLAMVIVPGGVIGIDAAGATRDFWVMAGATALLICALSFFGRLGKLWGGLMLAGFVAYTAWLVIGALQAGAGGAS